MAHHKGRRELGAAIGIRFTYAAVNEHVYIRRRTGAAQAPDVACSYAWQRAYACASWLLAAREEQA